MIASRAIVGRTLLVGIQLSRLLMFLVYRRLSDRDSSPASTVCSAKGPDWYLCLFYSCFLGYTRYVLMVASRLYAYLASLPF